MARPNSITRSSMQRGHDPFAAGFKKLRALGEWTSNARSEPVQESSKVLLKHIKKRVSKRAPGAQYESIEVGSRRGVSKRRRLKKYGTPAQAGASPHRQSGTLARSVRRAVVDGVMRVGTNDFTAPLHEYGAVISQQPSSARTGKSKAGHGSNRKGGTGWRKARHDSIVLPARPFMEPGFQSAKQEMTVKTMSALRAKGRATFGN